jgi:aminoglycoside phosphotransferase (APT) family kinase protein
MLSEFPDIEALIARSVPELAGQPIVQLTQGADKQVWSVGNDHVLRRATLLEFRPHLARERKLLLHLDGRTSLSLPKPIFVSPDGAFDVLRKAPGEPMDFSGWPTMDSQSQRRVAARFGRFLAELHNAVSPDVAMSMGYRRGFWPPSPGWVRDRLTGRLDSPQRCRLLDELLVLAPKLYEEVMPPVLLHDDFSHHNVGFSADGRDVAGVFDFTEARIGEPHRDLRYAFTFEPFAETMITEYEGVGGIKLDRKRLRAWHAWSALGSLALDLNEGNPRNLPLRWGWVDHVAAWDLADLRIT